MNVIQFESKQCETVQRYLDSYVSDELLVETNHEVLQHLETCAACSEALLAKRKMRNALHRAVRNQPLPLGLETKVRAQLRGSKSDSRWSAWLTVSLAMATVVVVLVTGSWFYQQNSVGHKNVEKLLAIGLRDHIVCAVGRHYSSSPPSMEKVAGNRNMGPQYSRLLPEVLSEWKEMTFVEGHRCNPGDRIYPHIIMKRDGMLVSLSLLEKQQGESFPSGWLLSAATVDGVKIFSAHQGPYSVAGFETAKHLAFVMTSLDEKGNIDLARKILPATVNILQPMEVSHRRPETRAFAWLASGSFPQTGAFRQ